MSLQIDIAFLKGEEGVIISDYKPSGEWELSGAEAKINKGYYSCCEEPYPDVTFHVSHFGQ